MKKRRTLLYLVLLIAAASLIITSCNGPASPTNESGSFAFKVTEKMISAINRAAVPDDTICTFTLHLYSADGTSYNGIQEKTDSLAALKGYTFDPFTSIPFGMKMYLKVEVKAGEELLFFSDVEEFTLTKTDGDQTVTVQMHRTEKPPLDTPFVLTWVSDSDNWVGTILILPDDTAFEPETSSLSSLATTIPGAKQIESEFFDCGYCFDASGVLWRLENNGVNDILCMTDSTGTTKKVTVTYDKESFWIDRIMYDSATDRICLLCENWIEDGSSGISYFYIKTFKPEEYLTWGETLAITTQDLPRLNSGSYELPVTITYAYDGFLYSLDAFDLRSGNKNVLTAIVKFDLTDGSMVKESFVSIPRAKPDNYKNQYLEDNEDDTDNFVFNDMAVIGDSVYILAYQKEVWATEYLTNEDYPYYPAYSYNDYEKVYKFNSEFSFDGETEEVTADRDFTNGGYVNRGGIIVLNAQTLEQTAVLGLKDIQDSLTLPQTAAHGWISEELVNNSSVSHFTESFCYTDSSLTEVATYEFPISFALPEWNESTVSFANPLKIVAIKPKKLVVLDKGTFYWIDDDKDENGNPKVVYKGEGEENPFIHTKEAVRLITVDLENFADSKITTVITDEAKPYSFVDETMQELVVRYGQYKPTQTVYVPKVVFDEPISQENKAFHLEDGAASGGYPTGSGFYYTTKLDLPF